MLQARVDAWHQLVAGEVLDAWRALPARDVRRDSADDERRIWDALKSAKKRAEQVTPVQPDGLVELARRAERHVDRQLERQLQHVHQAAGIELSAPDRRQLRAFVERNTRLIKSVDARFIEDVEGVIAQGLASGATTADMAQAIGERAGVSSSRATVVARDQVATATRQMTQARHEELGITEYEWLTASDERVRPACKKNAGKTFTWAQGDGGEHPGDRVMCRCQAVPIITLNEGLSAVAHLKSSRFAKSSNERASEIMSHFSRPCPVDERWNQSGVQPTTEMFIEELKKGTPRTRLGAMLLEANQNGDREVKIKVMSREKFNRQIQGQLKDPGQAMGYANGPDIYLPDDVKSKMSAIAHEISHAMDWHEDGKPGSPKTYEDYVLEYEKVLASGAVSKTLREQLAKAAYESVVEDEVRAFQTQNDYLISQGRSSAYSDINELREAVKDAYQDIFTTMIMKDFYGRVP